jgi:hypothetical protein
LFLGMGYEPALSTANLAEQAAEETSVAIWDDLPGEAEANLEVSPEAFYYAGVNPMQPTQQWGNFGYCADLSFGAATGALLPVQYNSTSNSVLLADMQPRYKFATRPRPGAPAPTILGGGLGSTGAIGAIGTAIGTPAVQMLFQMPLTLQNGTATIGEKNILISRIDVLRDVSRIVVQTITTDEGDLVLDDISTVLEAVCGFRNLKDFATRQYVSNVIVRFERNVEDSIGVLGEIQKILTPALQAATGITNQEPKLERIGFAFDPTLIPASKEQLTSFNLERRLQHPYSENRYFSGAPLRTGDHIRVLEQIGAILERGH